MTYCYVTWRIIVYKKKLAMLWLYYYMVISDKRVATKKIKKYQVSVLFVITTVSEKIIFTTPVLYKSVWFFQHLKLMFIH